MQLSGRGVLFEPCPGFLPEDLGRVDCGRWVLGRLMESGVLVSWSIDLFYSSLSLLRLLLFYDAYSL